MPLSEQISPRLSNHCLLNSKVNPLIVPVGLFNKLFVCVRGTRAKLRKVCVIYIERRVRKYDSIFPTTLCFKQISDVPVGVMPVFWTV